MAQTVQDLLAEARAAVACVDVSKARALLDRGVRFVDVREATELAAQGAIPGATPIPRSNLEWGLDGPDAPPRGDTVVFYCGGGGRSLLSAQRAAAMGYIDARSMDGGFKAWVAAGAPAQAPSG